jgi:hypothetical protein
MLGKTIGWKGNNVFGSPQLTVLVIGNIGALNAGGKERLSSL